MKNGFIFINAFVNHFPYAGLFLLLVLAGMGLPFPEEVTLMLCGFLASTQVIKLYYALPVAYAGMLVGDFMIYFTGKKLGRKVLTHRRMHNILSAEKLDGLEKVFSKHDVLLILLGRHLPVLRLQVFLVSGILNMSPFRFLLVDAISAVFTMTVLVGTGYLGGHSLAVVQRDLSRTEHLLVLAVLFLLACCFFYAYFRIRRDAARQKSDNMHTN